MKGRFVRAPFPPEHGTCSCETKATIRVRTIMWISPGMVFAVIHERKELHEKQGARQTHSEAVKNSDRHLSDHQFSAVFAVLTRSQSHFSQPHRVDIGWRVAGPSDETVRR